LLFFPRPAEKTRFPTSIFHLTLFPSKSIAVRCHARSEMWRTHSRKRVVPTTKAQLLSDTSGQQAQGMFTSRPEPNVQTIIR